MPDDDRTRRRLGDETKSRIDDLASGWSLDKDAPAPKPDDATRQKPPSTPPAPSADRRPAEASAPVASAAPAASAPVVTSAAIVASVPVADARTPAPIANPRTKPPTAPPPARPKTSSSPPPPPPPRKVGSASGAVPALPTSAPRSGPTGATAAVQDAPSAGARLGGGMKSGPTETGTVMRSGVIGGIPEKAPAVTASGAIPIADRSGAILESLPVAAEPARTKPPTKPPPPPPPRAGARTAPPPLPPGARRPTTAPPPAPVAPPPAPLVATALPLRADPTDVSPPSPAQVPAALPPAQATRPPPRVPTDDVLETIPEDEPAAMPRLAVPLGEFDSGAPGTLLDQDKLRIAYEQATMKRDAANALLGIAEQPMTVVKAPPVETLLTETAAHLMRGDPTSHDAPATTRFERGDPTGVPDPTVSGLPSPAPSGKLRAGATLRRKRGVAGDLRYVLTVLFGVRRARTELAELEARQELRRDSRRRHLVTLGRAAAAMAEQDQAFDHPALGPAREQLATVEDERSMHAGAVAAADSELQRVRRDREAKAKQYVEDLAALDAELAEVAKKLEPLEKESASIARRAGELRDSLRRIEQKLAATEASQHSVKGKDMDLAQIHAQIATLRADRIAVQRDEPKLAAELHALEPRIAALEARRSEARAKRAQLEQGEKDDQRRAEELLAAIGAKRKVVDRAAGDAEQLRDKILFELGERLYVDRPGDLTAQLAPIDEIDMDLGTGERRVMELREILSSIDKAKLARGISFAILILAAVGCLTAYVLYLAL